MQDKQLREYIDYMLDLQTRGKTFKTSGELLAYQRGLLTRFIIDLAKDDFYALGTLKNKVKSLESQIPIIRK